MCLLLSSCVLSRRRARVCMRVCAPGNLARARLLTRARMRACGCVPMCVVRVWHQRLAPVSQLCLGPAPLRLVVSACTLHACTFPFAFVFYIGMCGPCVSTPCTSPVFKGCCVLHVSVALPLSLHDALVTQHTRRTTRCQCCMVHYMAQQECSW